MSNPRNIVEKIIENHLVEGEMVPGRRIGIRIDQTLTQDATGTMAFLQFEAMKVPRVKTELSVSYVDHNTLQDGFENADDHHYLRTAAQKFGVHYSRAGNGICHQVHLERFAAPGKTLLGSDSHTPTGGGIGCFSIGAGGLDVALAMSGRPFFLTYPRVILVRLANRLRPWVTAKDVILKVLEILSTMGNVGYVLEYGGEGVRSLSVPERATIANMGAETGVTTSIFPADEVTRSFLKAQGREKDFVELKADPGAQYSRIIDIDLATLVPMLACPHSPGNVVPVTDQEGLKVDQVCIGSCTNASYQDLVTVAEIVKGRRIAPEMSLIVAPGSRQVLRMICESGHLALLVAAGARIAEPTCGFCIGRGYAPGSNEVSVRTNNRNFEGRCGTKSARVFLASPETAIACALAGKIVDPRSLDMKYPEVKMPEKFLIDDSMVIPPLSETESARIEIFRGPNIGDPPKNTAFPATLAGEVTLKVADKITTDHIMPAGNRLKYRSNIKKYSEFVFEPIDPDFHQKCTKNRDNGRHNIVVAGFSYGQGSSREHAAICPMYLGVKAVIAKSIERIHKANLVNFGILPLYFADESDYDRIEQGDTVEIKDIREKLVSGDTLNLTIPGKNLEIPLKCDLTAEEKEIVLAGGKLNLSY